MDKKEKIITVCLIGALALNSWQIYQLHRDIDRLEDKTMNAYNNLQNNASQSQNILTSHMEQLLTTQASLFSQTSVDCTLQGKQIAVTLHAIPKELKNDETLLARITTNGKTYEEPAGNNYQVTILLDGASSNEYIQPSFLIRSANGIKQEAIGGFFPSDYLYIPLDCDWIENSDDKVVLDIRLDKESTALTKAEITQANCIVVDTGIMERRSPGTRESAVSEIAAPLANGGIPVGDNVVAIRQDDTDSLHYQADLSKYLKQQEGILYDVYFVITTKAGISFVSTDNAIASFSYSRRDGSTTMSGGGGLVPIFASAESATE